MNEERVKVIRGKGSKAFMCIEGHTIKENGTRNKLAQYEWLEAGRGKQLFWQVELLAWLHFLDIAQDETRLWRLIHYQLEI